MREVSEVMREVMLEATLPHNEDAERAVLGACLRSNEAIGVATEMLKPEDFYNSSYGLLFGIIAGMYSSGSRIDMVTVYEEAKSRNLLEQFGGQMFFAGLMSSITTTWNIRTHTEIVLDYAIRRRLMIAGYRIVSIAQKPEYDSPKIIAEAEQEILKASQNMESSSPVSLKELSPSVMKSIGEIYSSGGRKVTGYPSGFRDLDNVLSGFQPGSLNVIAARPSMGKTALALNIAQFGGNDDSCVLLFSLEMSAAQLMYRMYSAESGVKLSKITEGQMYKDEFDRLSEASERLSERKIFINDSSELSAVEFRTKCRRFKTRHPELALIVVDYLQLMHTERKRNDNRQQETADISRMLKAVAVELECPVIALSQLSREVEHRTEKKPQLSDLRDSGAIEQDADTVILLYREDYYDEKKRYNSYDSKAELRIAKNRNGRTGVCSLIFQREYTRFVNSAEGVE